MSYQIIKEKIISDILKEGDHGTGWKEILEHENGADAQHAWNEKTTVEKVKESPQVAIWE